VTDDEALRRELLRLAAVLDLVTGALGGVVLLWAARRTYADNQRTWAYLIGALGVGLALVLAMVSCVIALTSHRTSGHDAADDI